MKNFLRRHKVKLALIVLIIVAVIAALMWAGSSNEGQIKESRSDAPVRGPSSLTFEGKYLTFEHKSTYKARTLEAKNDDLEVALLNADTNYNKNLSVAVSRIAGGNLENHSAYKLRQSDPANYSSARQDVAGSQAQLWAKKDGSEVTVFVPKNDRVAVLAFSTAGNQDDLNYEVQELLKTFKWKE